MLNKICIEPPFSIGIIGGGQLGKMMTVAAKKMGFRVVILDPTKNCPAAQVADKQIIASYDDKDNIKKLVTSCNVVTYEFEHIDSKSLVSLALAGYPIYPAPTTLQLIQNKFTQKQKLQKAGLPVASFMAIHSKDDIERAAELFGFPLLLKACTGGYDGKGNYLIRDYSDIEAALEALTGSPLMVEAYVSFSCEVSILVARDQQGNVVTYPLSENIHEDNILISNITPARVSEDVSIKAREIAGAAMELFAGVGVFCIELFVTAAGDILINEIAPRPHNSGHYTIEACVTSQFEQHIRAIAGLPLGSTQLIQPAVMVNLLGALKQSGPAVLLGCDRALAIPGVHLHFYGKEETAPKRKMGHATITGATVEEAIAIGNEIAGMLQVVARTEVGKK
ncbi:MAG: 5-(carboxyamino)imidazole ribonucleotide synthase [Bacillota bacterium]|nr:5-(carboxyamino)imidazole ribonucleotide synthase [Bacillota bacterium]